MVLPGSGNSGLDPAATDSRGRETQQYAGSHIAVFRLLRQALADRATATAARGSPHLPRHPPHPHLQQQQQHVLQPLLLLQPHQQQQRDQQQGERREDGAHLQGGPERARLAQLMAAAQGLQRGQPLPVELALQLVPEAEGSAAWLTPAASAAELGRAASSAAAPALANGDGGEAPEGAGAARDDYKVLPDLRALWAIDPADVVKGRLIDTGAYGSVVEATWCGQKVGWVRPTAQLMVRGRVGGAWAWGQGARKEGEPRVCAVWVFSGGRGRWWCVCVLPV